MNLKRNNSYERTNSTQHAALPYARRTGLSRRLCDVITKNLNTDYTATRMIGYLCQYSYLPEEQLVDEMLAILSDRDALIKKKEMEQAQAKIMFSE